jgi:hypothetical protein
MNKISWLGTFSSVAGSFTVAMKFLVAGYSLFLIGAVSWLIVGIVRRDSALIALNGAFLFANLIGLYNA